MEARQLAEASAALIDLAKCAAAANDPTSKKKLFNGIANTQQVL